MKKVELYNELLKISFTFSYEILEKVKSLENRKYSGEKYWTAPPSLTNLKALKKFGFEFSSEIQKIFNDLNNPKKIDLSKDPALNGLFPFQIKGVEFLESRNGRGLIGDEMGIGKTIQALGYLKLHPELRPAIIVCPASLKLNWAKETKAWINDQFSIASGKSNPIENKPIIIINYDIISAKIDELLQLNPQCLVLDEIHLIKNSKTQRTKAIKKLAKKIQSVIALTGTPIISKPIEFFNILNILDKNEWPSYWSYAHRYCDAKHNGFGWNFNGASNMEELNQRVRNIMIRRLKSEVLPELPKKIRSVIPLEINNLNEYKKAENDFIEWLTKKEGEEKANKIKRAQHLTRIEKLKQLAVLGKLENTKNWILNFLESGEKLVIFCTHTNTINYYFDIFNKMGIETVKLNGESSINQKNIAVSEFQNNKNCKLFVGNLKAAGVGLTLTAASSVCFVELGWTPGEHDQAEDRVHRIGQTSNTTNIYYLIANQTIETEIAELLDKKRGVIASVLDGKSVDQSSLLTELIKKLALS